MPPAWTGARRRAKSERPSRRHLGREMQLAGGPGFEPRLPGPEPGVLPLNYPPKPRALLHSLLPLLPAPRHRTGGRDGQLRSYFRPRRDSSPPLSQNRRCASGWRQCAPGAWRASRWRAAMGRDRDGDAQQPKAIAGRADRVRRCQPDRGPRALSHVSGAAKRETGGPRSISPARSRKDRSNE